MKTGTSVTVDYSRLVLNGYNVAFFHNFRILPESNVAREYC